MNIYSFVTTTDKILRKAMYQAHEGRCFYTGQFVDPEDMEVDHIVPASKGGRDYFANYVLTSHFINMKKLDNYDPVLAERMLYINSIVFAPKVFNLYRTFATKGDSRKIALIDFCRLQGIKTKNGQLPRIKSTVRSRLECTFDVPPGRVKPQPMFDFQELQLLHESEPGLFS